jgi:hypothetical protein
MEQKEQGLQVLNKENVEIIGTASKVLTRNQTSVENAKKYGEKLVELIGQKGMSDELDRSCNQYLVQLAKTEKSMKERRTPITGIFDMVRSEFTGLEKEVSKSGRLFTIIQQKRNEFARAKAEKERKRQEAAQLKLNQENERVEVVSKIRENIEWAFSKHLEMVENEIYDTFQNATLADFDKTMTRIENEAVKAKINLRIYEQASIPKTMYIEQVEVDVLLEKTIQEIKPKHEERFWSVLDELRINLSEKAPGRKQELQELAELEKKNKEEAAILKKQQEEREAKEKKEREAKAAQAKVEAQAKLDSEKEASKLNNLFNATSEAAVSNESKSQVRKSLKIFVSHQSAWVEIFTFYMQTEGMKLGIDELGKKSLNQMKAFCEKHATKTGEKISSKYVKYEEDYTAVNK